MWQEVPKNLTIAASIETWAKGRYKFVSGQATFDGQPVPSDISRRIKSMVAEGKDPVSLFRFWERLKKNPSFRSVNQLWNFLQHENIPLTPDGCFLAYKSVTQEYKDHHSGKFDNSPGVTNEMPRNEISDDPDLACHDGFHVGALGYVNATYPSGRKVICKVDPEHVVCVPKDSRSQKIRVCKYKVVGNYGVDLPSTVFEEEPEPEPEAPTVVAEDLEEEEEEYDDIEEDLEEEDSSEKEERVSQTKKFSPPKDETPPTVTQIGTATSTKAAKKLNKKYAKFHAMDAAALMALSLAELRTYATYGLEIVGASKIIGGKTALVSTILGHRGLP